MQNSSNLRIKKVKGGQYTIHVTDDININLAKVLHGVKDLTEIKIPIEYVSCVLKAAKYKQIDFVTSYLEAVAYYASFEGQNEYMEKEKCLKEKNITDLRIKQYAK